MNNNNQHQEKKGGHFFNGFFWGAALGGGLTYLLSTKRGRDLLKNLVQDGLDMLENATVPQEEITPEEFLPASQEIIAEEPVVFEATSASIEPEKKVEQPPKKRFFRPRKK